MRRKFDELLAPAYYTKSEHKRLVLRCAKNVKALLIRAGYQGTKREIYEHPFFQSEVAKMKRVDRSPRIYGKTALLKWLKEV
jgi:hypothetical protein